MTVLSDIDISRAIRSHTIAIDPYNEDDIQPASYDVHLGPSLLRVETTNNTPIDPLKLEDDDIQYTDVPLIDGQFLIDPYMLYLGSTVEVVSLNYRVGARFEGKSSLGRIGMQTHMTAGYIDPGFWGQITLEIVQSTDMQVLLTPGMPIGQLSFFELTTPCVRPYGSAELGSHYWKQMGPTKARSLKSV